MNLDDKKILLMSISEKTMKNHDLPLSLLNDFSHKNNNILMNMNMNPGACILKLPPVISVFLIKFKCIIKIT